MQRTPSSTSRVQRCYQLQRNHPCSRRASTLTGQARVSLWRLRLYKICNWSLNDLEPKKLFISCGTLYKNTPWPTGTVSQNPFKEMWKSDTGGLPNPEHIFGHLFFSMGSIQSIQLSGNVAHSPLLCTWHMHHTLRAAG